MEKCCRCGVKVEDDDAFHVGKDAYCTECFKKYRLKIPTQKGNNEKVMNDTLCGYDAHDDELLYEPTHGDPVNHPDHYTSRTMEAIDIIEMIIDGEQNPKVAYNMSNVLKYLLRFRKKGKSTEDLKKAKWYLDRMIQKVEEENDG